MRSAPQVSATTGGTIPMVVVLYGPSLLALPSDIVRGILEPDEAGQGSTIYAYGLTFPTTDLATHLGLWRPSAPPEARIILCERQHMRRAIHVDQVVSLTDVPQQGIQPLPAHFSGLEREWFAGLFVLQDQIVLLVNPVWLLRSETLVTSIEDQRAPEPEEAPAITLLEPGELGDHDIVELRRGANGEDATWRHK